MKNVNLGLIGLGTMGKVHLHNALYLPNVTVVGVSDTSKRALRYAKNIGVQKTYNDYIKLCNNANSDAIIISTPTYLHSECIKIAAEEGKDIFVEKPLARNVKEGKQILSYVKKAGVKLMVGYPLIFFNNFSLLKDKIQDSFFGAILVATATNIWSGPFRSKRDKSGPISVPEWWFDTKLTGGGALLDLGSHMINLLNWFFGEVIDVKSYLGYRFNMDFEDHAVCLIKFKEGPIATINVGYFSKESRMGVDIYGTVKHVSEIQSFSSRSIVDFGIKAIKKKLSIPEKTMYHKELEYFIECIRSDVSPHPSGEEGLIDLEIITKAYKNSIHFDSRARKTS